MELIINQLSEIEAASVKIIEHATEQKKEVAEHFKQLTWDFDEQVELDTEAAVGSEYKVDKGKGRGTGQVAG